MPIDLKCPSCGKNLSVPDRVLGKRVRCSGCKSVFNTRTTGTDSATRTRDSKPHRKRRFAIGSSPDRGRPPVNENVRGTSETELVGTDWLEAGEDDWPAASEGHETLPLPLPQRKKKTRKKKSHHTPYDFPETDQLTIGSRLASQKVSAESGIPILVFAVIGVLFVPLCLPVAWILGNSYLHRCAETNQQPDGYGIGGRLVGKIFTYLWLIGISVIIFVVLQLIP
jgi:phage FluMu protein Com